jgi:phospholipase C
MQENRSFDSYFGLFPGADGIPMASGQPSVCIPDPNGPCQRPFHEAFDRDTGGPHGLANATADINGGKMDGFVAQARASLCQLNQQNPDCSGSRAPDVMGYKNAQDIPNYWKYATDFVLQDRMFEADDSWSLPEHLFLVSEWSARCRIPRMPSSCANDNVTPADTYPDAVIKKRPSYAWTDLTYLMHKAKVSWKYYVGNGSEPDCPDDSAIVCPDVPQSAATPGIWNPLPYFTTVQQDGEVGRIQPVSNLFSDLGNGALPSVSWIVPSRENSEHPPSSVARGQAYVTYLVNSIMQSPAWASTAIFVSWDDWGGFYDHVAPPRVDQNGYGLRVPGLLISPYAKRGLVDHQLLSSDAYVKLIEDVFLGGARIDPSTDGRPDPRISVRENQPTLGDLSSEFDFSQPPRSPELLPTTFTSGSEI